MADGPLRRTARATSGVAGVACALAALVGPLAEAGQHDLTAHMAGHLLLGMVAPLLLVLADPVTLALRTLPVARARELVRVLRSRPARLLTHPATATVLDVGGLWVLYRTGLFAVMMTSPPVHALVMAHVLLAGWLFTHAVAGYDPTPSRPSFAVRAAWLVAGLAAHEMLARSLVVHPPAMAGMGAVGAGTGAALMYYGGDVVDVVLMVLLCAQWYAATAPGRRRPRPGTGRIRGSVPRRRPASAP